MWKYNNPDELYHWGILGMHWGRRTNNKQLLKQQKQNKLIKDNDKRVRIYGKNSVKIANRGAMAFIGYGSVLAASTVHMIGKETMSKIASDPSKGNISFRLAEGATLAALGTIGVMTVRTISSLHKDNKLADGYRLRQKIKRDSNKK